MGEERAYRDLGQDAALDRLAAGGGLLVLGPSGCGRSALLAALAAGEEVQRRVWWCRGRHVGEPSGDRPIWSGDVEALWRDTAAEPTTVLVDDAHLLGDPVVDRLVSLAERRQELGLRMAVSRRTMRPGPALARLDAMLVGTRGAFHLSPLGVDAVAHWLADEHGSDTDLIDPAEAAEIVARTGGWPELVAADVAASRPDATGSRSGVADLARARLAQLESDHQRVMRAVSFGLPPGSAALTEATATDNGQVDAAVEAAWTAGLVHEGSGPVPAIAAALRTATPVDERAGIAAATRSCGPADLVVTVARHLAAHDDRTPEAGLLFERAADMLLSAAVTGATAGGVRPKAGTAAGVLDRSGDRGVLTAPAEAADLLEAAIRAGRPAEALVAKRAVAALAAGRAEGAAVLAAEALSRRTTVDRAPATNGTAASVAASGAAADGLASVAGLDVVGLRRVAGGAWAHMAAPDLASDWYQEAGEERVLAVVPLLAAGRIEEARKLLAEAGPTASAAVRAFAEGAVGWMEGEGEQALAVLERGAQLAQVHGGTHDWPESPHALLVLAAGQLLDTARAERVAQAAAAWSVGGPPFDRRHRLLLAWAALRSGRLDDAQAALDTLPPAPPDMIRDATMASVLAAAIALRTAKPADLPKAHAAALSTASRSAPDPFAPDLAGELAHLAARVGDDPEPILGPLEELAAALGDPVTLEVPLAWARLMVAVARDDAAGSRHAAGKLRATAGDGHPTVEARRLMADVAETFADVLGGHVDAPTVRAVADRLTGRGLVFEASRLIGAASLRCDDAAATRSLLADLRRLQTTQVRSGPRRPRPVADLSEREREVARAVLDGHTHREIGARLYISAKTVEHHVARIRQKLGATDGTRAELLAAIRDELDRTASPA